MLPKPHCCILGTGCYLPDRVVTNFDLAQVMETSDEFIVERTGVRRRRYAPPELAAQLADMNGRAIGEHFGIGATAVGANRRRLTSRPDALQVVETLGRKLRKKIWA